MQFFKSSFPALGLVVAAVFCLSTTAASAASAAASSCKPYTIITTRGTFEDQGIRPASFKPMIAATFDRVPGGDEYSTVYPAARDQNSTAGTDDIMRYIHATLSDCPEQLFAMLGFSQGAAATTDALIRITKTQDHAAFAAIRVVILLGNTRHTPGLASNFDAEGTKLTANGKGKLASRGGIPDEWDRSHKVVDICAVGDVMCGAPSTTVFAGIHNHYDRQPWAQAEGIKRMVMAFQ